MSRNIRIFFIIVFVFVASLLIALPSNLYGYSIPQLEFSLFGKNITTDLPLKQGLDIQGGMQVVLQADMSGISAEDRSNALESAREVINRRVDMYGISEPLVQTSQRGDEYRIIVELAGIDDPQQALALVGTTAQLDFRLQEATESATASDSAQVLLNQFVSTGLTGKELQRSTVQFDPQTGEPVVSLEFNDEGRDIFADVTKNHTGEILAIFLDDFPVMFPQIQSAILDGKAVISGNMTLEEAKNLNIQLNAGALPVPITVLEQRNIGASLGQQSVEASVKAGMIGIGLVMLFMILYYGYKGFLASMALLVYSALTIAVYKVMGVTLTLPGIAGLLLSIGMAVDSNILIFERMKEELRDGKEFHHAMELGFGRAWDSIKDANLATITTALILINPFNMSFLNTSGLVRGFGITLLIGVVISLFTGIVVTRTLMRLFLK